MFDHRFQRREAGPAAEHQDRPPAVVADEERPERALKAQDVALGEPVKNVFGKIAAVDVADVQLQKGFLVRRRGERKSPAAPFAGQSIASQYVNILAGQKLHAHAFRQGEPQLHHARRQKMFLTDPGRQDTDRNITNRFDFTRFDHDVAAGHRLAQQDLAAADLAGIERRRRLVGVLDNPVHQCRVATGARPVAARVRQDDALAQRRGQDGLAGTGGESFAAAGQFDSRGGVHRRASYRKAAAESG